MTNIAGHITNFYLDKDGTVVLEGITIPTPYGKELEKRLLNGEHLMFAMKCLWDIPAKYLNSHIRDIVGFTVVKKLEPNPLWEIQIESEEKYWDKEPDRDKAMEDDEFYIEAEPWYETMSWKDIAQIYVLIRDIQAKHPKSQLINMTPEAFFTEVLIEFKNIQELSTYEK